MVAAAHAPFAAVASPKHVLQLGVGPGLDGLAHTLCEHCEPQLAA
jgi:hypothetical protein